MPPKRAPRTPRVPKAKAKRKAAAKSRPRAKAKAKAAPTPPEPNPFDRPPPPGQQRLVVAGGPRVPIPPNAENEDSVAVCYGWLS